MNSGIKMPDLRMDRFRMLIGGELVESENWFPSINPANEATEEKTIHIVL